MQNIYLQDVVLLKTCLQNDGKAGEKQNHLKDKKADWGILAWNSLMGCLHATLYVNRIQGSSSRLLDTWAKHGWIGQ